jgi:hypothetical protein
MVDSLGDIENSGGVGESGRSDNKTGDEGDDSGCGGDDAKGAPLSWFPTTNS